MSQKVTPTAEVKKQQTIDSMASETMLGTLKDLVKQELAAAQKPWQAMSEQEQSDALHRIEMSLRQAIIKATKLIASEGRQSMAATLEQVVFKDGIKVVLKIPKGSAHSHELADHSQKSVFLVLSDPDQHMGGAEDVKSEPDQRALLADGGNATH